MSDKKSSLDIMSSLAGTTRVTGMTSAVSYNLEGGVTGLIATFPKGVKPANEVLDALYDWAEDKGLDNVVEKIIELEESK